jgi:hypothetical protein
MSFIKVPSKYGDAVIAVQHIVNVVDLERTEGNPERGAMINCQVRTESYQVYTTMRATDVFAELEAVVVQP